MGQTGVAEQIGALVQGQPFAVLCTQGEGQPYGSLVAFAATDDLRAIVFSTPVHTRKYRLLEACERVALVIDSRPASSDQILRGQAVTATGRAIQVSPGQERDRFVALLAEHHPALESFLGDLSTAVFRIDVDEYVYVTRFQQVNHWQV